MTREPGINLIIVPEDGGSSRSFRFRRRTLWLYGALASLGLLLLVTMVVSWGLLAARAARVDELERSVAALEAERGRVVELARSLEELEARYARVREMFGVASGEASSGVWLPPPAPTRDAPADGDSDVPDAWPLAARGMVTQELLDAEGEEHPGVDIAVASDTYIRAAGAGVVSDVGEDPVYGHYVVVEHAGGYRTLYAHASLVLAAAGNPVRRGEVIALSGNSGRSSSPHLHFEILLDGVPLDPLELIQPPG